MTWLPTSVDGATDRAAVLGLQAEAFACYEEFLKAVAAANEADLLEVCRARMAQMLGCREELARHTPERLAAVESWEQSPDISDKQRAALRFTEQFVMDPALVDRELVAELERELRTSDRIDFGPEYNFGTPGMVNFATAIAVYEYSMRLAALLDLAPENSR